MKTIFLLYVVTHYLISLSFQVSENHSTLANSDNITDRTLRTLAGTVESLTCGGESGENLVKVKLIITLLGKYDYTLSSYLREWFENVLQN